MDSDDDPLIKLDKGLVKLSKPTVDFTDDELVAALKQVESLLSDREIGGASARTVDSLWVVYRMLEGERDRRWDVYRASAEALGDDPDALG